MTDVAIIGRCSFSHGIGAITYAFAEALSRAYDVRIVPTEPALRASGEDVVLPSGRRLPTLKNADGAAISVFTDVIWNGVMDLNFTLVPDTGLRVACLCLDGDEFPPEWTKIVNERFDIVVVPSSHLVPVARQSGVEIPLSILPLALDLGPALTLNTLKFRTGKVHIGSVASFHRRKGARTLISAFLEEFDTADQNVTLSIHSNLRVGHEHAELIESLRELAGDRVTLSNVDLSRQDLDRFFANLDIYVNLSQGEGYSIGPREALAHGKVCVLSAVGGHLDLGGIPGVFMVGSTEKVPARYPEIDNRIFGSQMRVAVADAAAALRSAYEFVRSGEADNTCADRQAAARQFDFEALSPAYSAVINPASRLLRYRRFNSPLVHITEEAELAARSRGPKRWEVPRDVVVEAHDGGFFSLFNTYLTNLVWAERDLTIDRVIPDWIVSSFIERHPDQVTSFCYGQPEDGNLWSRLFEPVFDLTDEQMDDAAWLADRSRAPREMFNSYREPDLTFTHAYKLYKQPSFHRVRRQYHASIQRFVKLRPHLFRSIQAFADQHFEDKFVITAHVRHPSHVVEQPNMEIAGTDKYIAAIVEQLALRGIAETSPGWKVFLATDQDRVVTRMRDRFGDCVAVREDVRRTTVEEDRRFDALSPSERSRDGFQLQHVVASSRSTWSRKMAEDVIIDAYLMARTHLMLHVVSNVSTAVSFINPDVEMVFCG